MRNTAYRQNILFDLDWFTSIQPERRVFVGDTYLRAKRSMDIGLVLLTLPFWLSLIISIFFILKISDPTSHAIFCQQRTGKCGKKFKLYKFRTMIPGAEHMKKQLEHLNELKWPDFKISNDPRVSRFGRILRKSSLDELPQLFNVLRGEMSLVGPRPTSFGPETYNLWHTERLEVIPGITGLWQILGRGSINFDDRLRLDIAYIKRRCVWLDIQILFRTIFSILKQRGTF